MKNKFFNFILSTRFLALILALLIIYFLPDIFNKYEIKLLKRENNFPAYFIYYADLDNDGNSEKILVNKTNKNRDTIIVFRKGKIVNQWSFASQKILPKAPFWGDINNDDSRELFIFTYKDSAIFLTCFNPLKDKIFINKKQISGHFPHNNTPDCQIQCCGFYDNNSDEFNEFYFTITAGFSKHPRKMYAFDIANDTLYSSPESCTNILNPFAVDLNGDGKMEFSGRSAALGNCDSNCHFTDMHSWLMVFDEKMNFKFDPVKIGHYPSNLDVQYIKSGDSTLLVTFNAYYGTEDYKNSISLFNSKGKLIKKKEFASTEEWINAYLIKNSVKDQENLFIVKQDGLIEKVDSDLNTVYNQKLPAITNYKPFMLDIDNDNKKEFLFVSKYRDKIIITRNDFSHPVIIDTQGINEVRAIALFLTEGEKSELFIGCDNFLFFYRYYQNPLYYLKYLIYIGIYLGIFAVFLGTQKIQKYKYEQKYQAEKKIAELQMKSIKNQVDPHFTFNVINSIGSLFNMHNTEKADYIFGKYCKLLRSTILSSDKILTSIEQELDYVENYLELERFRLKNSFAYTIETDDAVDIKLKIPKMMIHTFVENAIKHGLRHTKSDGNLEIKLNKNQNYYKILIRDNGIGRKKAKELPACTTGKGLEILEQIFDLYFILEKIRITYNITDLYDEFHNAAGTEVCIKIPFLSE